MQIETKAAAISLGQADSLLREIEARHLRESTRKLWDTELESWAQGVLDELGVDITFDILNPLVVAHIDEFSGTRINGINDTTLSKVRKQLHEGVELGEDYKRLAKRIRTVFRSADRHRSVVISRTETLRSSNFATHQAHVKSGVVEKREWISTPDDRVREQHLAMDGQVRAINAPFQFPDGTTTMYPGESGVAAHDIQCMVPGILVEGAFVGGVRSLYSGPVVTIETRRGCRLTVTPNHPVLTTHGFVPAGLLSTLDNLVSHTAGAKPAPEPPDYIHDGPTTAEEVFGALAALAPVAPIRRYAEQLHGDAELCQGDIDVVDMLGVLNARSYTASSECIEQSSLAHADSVDSAVSRECSVPHLVNGPGTATTSLVRGGDLPPAVLPAHLRPLDQFRIGPAADLHPVLPEPPVEAGPGYAGFVADLLERGAGQVVSDQVIDIRDGTFSGHVYDLQSTSGWLVANGVIISNCRCTTAAYFPDGEPSTITSRRLAGQAYHRKVTRWEKKAEKGFRRGFKKQHKSVQDQLATLSRLNGTL